MELSRRELIAGMGGLVALPSFGAATAGGIQQVADELRKRAGVPGLGLLVVRAGGTPQLAVSGVRKVGSPGLVTPGDHWQLGSISKTFTATLVAKLVDRRLVAWDDSLGKIFPEWRRDMAPGVEAVTIRQLLAHRSGFGDDVIPWQGNEETNAPGLKMTEVRSRFIRRAVRAPLLFAPGSRERYSNQGYNLLGHLVERVSGISWEDAIRDWIAKPLGIDPRFGEPALDAPEAEPWPHVYDNGAYKPVEPVPRSWVGYHMCNPAGGLTLSLADFARWTEAQLRGPRSGGILSPETFALLQAPNGVHGFFPGQSWPATARVFGHTGSNGRNFADCAFLPERGVGVFWATNCSPDPRTNLEAFAHDALLALALPSSWPAPALAAPTIPASGILEGESLLVKRVTGGSVSFQNFAHLSGGFQTWWANAKDGDRLDFSFGAPRAGRYAVSMRCATNVDFAAVSVAVGGLQRDVDFRTPSLEWREFDLGECRLKAGENEMGFVARGSAGQSGILCHLGLDALRFRYLGA